MQPTVATFVDSYLTSSLGSLSTTKDPNSGDISLGFSANFVSGIVFVTGAIGLGAGWWLGKHAGK